MRKLELIMVGVIAALLSACAGDPHPEYKSTTVVPTEQGPRLLVIDHEFLEEADSDGLIDEDDAWREPDGVLLSEDYAQTIDPATGVRTPRRSMGFVNTVCAPARLGTVWCNGVGARDPRVELRTVFGRRLLGPDEIIAASGGRIAASDFARAGLTITPTRHELVLRTRGDGGARAAYAVDPTTLEARPIDTLEESVVDNTGFRRWTASRLAFDGSVYEIGGPFGATGSLTRRPVDDPDAEPEVLGTERAYRDGGIFVQDPIDAPQTPLSVDDPPSLFLVAPTDEATRVSRVRVEDGEVLYTHVGRVGRIDAAAIVEGTFVFVIRGESAVWDEAEATIVGLDVATGAELYRHQVPDDAE